MARTRDRLNMTSMKKSLLSILLLLLPIPLLGAYHTTVRFSAQVAPQEFIEKSKGPFGVLFIPTPQFRLLPVPQPPSALIASSGTGVIRVALRVGKKGNVTDVQIIESIPFAVTAEESMALFGGICFEPHRIKREPVEFETEIVVGFKPKEESKDSSEVVPRK